VRCTGRLLMKLLKILLESLLHLKLFPLELCLFSHHLILQGPLLVLHGQLHCLLLQCSFLLVVLLVEVQQLLIVLLCESHLLLLHLLLDLHEQLPFLFLRLTVDVVHVLLLLSVKACLGSTFLVAQLHHVVCFLPLYGSGVRKPCRQVRHQIGWHRIGWSVELPVWWHGWQLVPGVAVSAIRGMPRVSCICHAGCRLHRWRMRIAWSTSPYDMIHGGNHWLMSHIG